MRFAGRAAGVYDVHSMRLAGRDGQVGVADASKKGPIFLLKAALVSFRGFFRPSTFVFSIATPGALDAERHLII